MTCPSPTALLSCHPVTTSAKIHVVDLVVTHTGGQNEGLCRVHSNRSDVVWMGLERCDLLRGVVVVYTQLEVIGTYIRALSAPICHQPRKLYPTCNYPILPCNEATGTNGYIGKLEGFDDRLRDIRPYMDVSCLGQPAASIMVSKLCVPLYNVVRIHGSVG